MAGREPTVRPVEERFWGQVKKTDGCWYWTGTPNGNGYGRIGIKFDRVLVHRLAYEMAYGLIPAGLVVDHECHNADRDCPGGRCPHRLCVRPDHLALKTLGDNLLSSENTEPTKNIRKTRCPKDHEYTQTKWGRRCYECIRERDRKRYARRAAEDPGFWRRYASRSG